MATQIEPATQTDEDAFRAEVQQFLADNFPAELKGQSNALAGVRAALAEHKTLPPAYRGVAIYSAWTMSDADWRELREAFCADSLAPRGAE